MISNALKLDVGESFILLGIRCTLYACRQRVGTSRMRTFWTQKAYLFFFYKTGEPEIVLSKQLEFLYRQILLVLTSKVHEILRSDVLLGVVTR